jgi:hypothetical protein
MNNDGSFICIGSSRLTVEIARSGLLYQRSRFDRTGQIRQVRLDDGTVFCGADTRSASQNCGAFGLMNEYMPSDQGTYDTADPDGGVFLKMGVGLLRRVGPEAYSQKTDYPVAEKAIVKEWADANTYHASVSQREFNGFAYVAERTLTIYQDSLLSSYCVQNKGVKALHFNEYAHNFYCTGKNRFAWDMLFFTSFEAEPHPQELIKQGKRFRIQPFEQVAACELTDWLEIGAVPPNIAVQCPDIGIQISETLQAPRFRSFLWTLPDTVCPELIAGLDAAPGEKICWSRNYTFRHLPVQ